MTSLGTMESYSEHWSFVFHVDNSHGSWPISASDVVGGGRLSCLTMFHDFAARWPAAAPAVGRHQRCRRRVADPGIFHPCPYLGIWPHLCKVNNIITEILKQTFELLFWKKNACFNKNQATPNPI